MSNTKNQSRAVRCIQSGGHGIAMGVSVTLLAIGLAVPAALAVLFLWPLFLMMALLPLVMSGNVRPSPVAVNVPQVAVIPPPILTAHVMRDMTQGCQGIT